MPGGRGGICLRQIYRVSQNHRGSGTARSGLQIFSTTGGEVNESMKSRNETKQSVLGNFVTAKELGQFLKLSKANLPAGLRGRNSRVQDWRFVAV